MKLPPSSSLDLQPLLSEGSFAYHMYSGISSGIIIQDPFGNVLDANAAALELLGLTLSQLQGHASFLPGWSASYLDGTPLRGMNSPARQTARTGLPVHDAELIIQLPSQGKRWLLSHTDPVSKSPTGDLEGIITVLTNITERKHLKLQEAILKNINHRILLEEPLDDTLTAFCSELVKNCDYAWAWIGFKEPDGSISLHGVSGLEPANLSEAQLRWDNTPEGQTPSGLAIRTGQPQLLDYQSSNCQTIFNTRVKNQGIQSGASFPLQFRGDTFGTLTLHTRIPDYFTESVVTRLEFFAAQIAFSLVSARNFEQLAQYRLLADYTKDILLFLNPEGKILNANSAAVRTYGYSKDELLTMSLHDLRPPETWSTIPEQLTSAFDGHISFATSHVRSDQTTFPVEVTSQGTTIGGQKIILNIVRDVSERQQAHLALKTSEKRYRKMFEHMSNPAIVCALLDAKAGFILKEMNSAAEKLYDIPRGAVIGQNLATLISSEHQDFQAVLHQVHQSGRPESYLTNSTRFGRSFELYTYKLTTTELVVIYEDVTDRQALEQQLTYHTQHDALTGLPNRLLLNAHLSQAIAHAAREDIQAAVLLIDLDNFKLINDSYGHSFGDLVLKTVAKRIEDHVQNRDIVAHQSEDEFVVTLPEITDPNIVLDIAQTILTSLSQPFAIENKDIIITASIGISLYPSLGQNIEALLQHAETAMFYAKSLGGNNYQLYTPALDKQNSERLALEADLRKALDRNEFQLYYQPQLDLETNQITGVEALVRWNSPERGLVSPIEFIPVAEATGLIIPLGEWVLTEACTQMTKWLAAGYSLQKIAVNLSAKQFLLPDLVPTITRTLAEAGLAPEFLELEITESAMMENTELTVATLKELKKLGIRLSIDDFGTGFSSLNYLRLLPLDKLKVDQSFVQDIGKNDNGTKIVSTIIDLAKKLKLHVLAEGVETTEQLHFLRQEECDEIQGYLLSKPIPAQALEHFLQHKSHP